LTPDDFGLVATSAMIVAFASILWEAGLSKALIQNHTLDLNKMANVVFYTNIFLSTLIYAFLLFGSDIIALIFQDPRVSSVIKVSGLTLILGSLMSVQTALLQRELKFKAIFYNRFIGAVIPGATSVFLAYYGYGYWALVYGSIISMILQVIVLWKLSNWRPSISYDTKVASQMFNFSKWVLLSGLLSWFFIWGDIFILGLFFSSHEIGLYRTANYFVTSIIGIVANPIVPVMYTYFSKIQHDKEKIKTALLLTSKLISFLILPIGVGLYVIQNPLSSLIFGEKWEGIAPVIGYLSLAHAMSWMVSLSPEAYKAIGRPDIEMKVYLISVSLYLIIYVLSSLVSFSFFIKCRFFLVFFGLLIHLYFMKYLLKITYLEFFKNIKFILAMAIVVIVFKTLFDEITLLRYNNNLLVSSIILTLYLIFMVIIEKKNINYLILTIRRINT
ncbi:MAG: lipopolysaccharide biosynthesis protein, partial [Nitrososphaeria archaeon]